MAGGLIQISASCVLVPTDAAGELQVHSHTNTQLSA